MTTRATLEAMSSTELHDLAFQRAERHVDVGFFYDLLSEIPAAAAATGQLDRGTADVFSLRRRIAEVMHANDEGGLKDALRPIYIEYLQAHDDWQAPSPE